jgi:hypothetical protein
MPTHRARGAGRFALALPFLALAALPWAPAEANAQSRNGEQAARPAAARPAAAAATPARSGAANGQRRDTPARAPAAARGPAAQPAAPPESPWEACTRAIAAAEPGSGLPPGLLGAIARVETGRRAPDGRIAPWPWSFNAAGEGRYAATRAEAVAEVQARLAAGTRSIDIGCMQINLLHHPDAFPSVDAGFDPAANVAYAIRFLRGLHAQTGDWAQATARYHSATPERGVIYHQRVMAALSGQGFVPGPAPGVIPLPGPAMAGLCASGRGAVLLVGTQAPSLRPVVAVPNVELRLRGRPAAGPARPRIMCLPTSSRAAPG